MRSRFPTVSSALLIAGLIGSTAFADVSLNGSWQFRFEESQPLERVFAPDFVATDVLVVPSCFDVMPKWYLKHGTGLYRRTFHLDAALTNGVLTVDGMGIRARFAVDGRDLGLYDTPYARLEVPVGPLAAGEHTLVAAVDNIMEWPRVKLARPYYDFYFYGGFYHGIRIGEKVRKVFVSTTDWRTKSVKIRVEGEAAARQMTLPDAKLWSPDEPNLTTITVDNRPVRFGLRQIEAREGKLYLNGKELFLKGFNRHESEMSSGSATGEALMLQDLQRLKALGGNFIRGAHYQQCERFLDLCDELGVLVWEESLGWGNGQSYTSNGGAFPPNEFRDEGFRSAQIRQTREMVRASFNHPSVIIYGFLNEPNAALPEAKTLIDELIATIKREDSGRLVTFACNLPERDICNENTDLIAFNAYPGTIPAAPGTPEEFRHKTQRCFNEIIALFRQRYPKKPIIVSESGCGGVYGIHDANASVNTEEYQEEYLRYIFETLWANPDCSGFAIWQMNDGRTRERFCDKTCSAMFGKSVAGAFDPMRRPKLSTQTIRRFFHAK